MPTATHFTVVVIGTGFGGTMTALPIAREIVRRNKGESILMLERGTWWTTPVGTVQDKEVKTYDYLVQKGQPVQFWSTLNNFRGFVDIFTRCLRRKKNEAGHYDFSLMGRRGLLGFLGRQNDGVNVVRACGVGGGSLVYSNITIRPPDFIFDDPRWPLTWTGADRDAFYELARNAIGKGLLWALNQPGQNLIPPMPPPAVAAANPVNTGLSNIVTRTAGIDPHWRPPGAGGLKQINLNPPAGQKDPNNDLWIDRARLFQTAISELTPEFGTVDLSINDFDPSIATNQHDAKNYCERQGRCNVGCLPGARHTLNKQLMAAILGRPNMDNPEAPLPPLFTHINLEPLSDVDYIEARPQGGYAIHYDQQDTAAYIQGEVRSPTRKVVTADIVIVAAGCLGTNAIMLRS